MSEKQDLEVDGSERSIEEGKADSQVALKLDDHGLPLVPQPTDDPNDPLNWSDTKKYSVLAVVSILSFFSTFALAVMNPACLSQFQFSFIPCPEVIPKMLKLDWRLTIQPFRPLTSGQYPLLELERRVSFWSPVANVYGRRPVLLFAQTIAVIAGFASSFAPTYGKVLGKSDLTSESDH